MTGLNNHRVKAEHGAGNIVENGGPCLAKALAEKYIGLMVDKWNCDVSAVDEKSLSF